MIRTRTPARPAGESLAGPSFLWRALVYLVPGLWLASVIGWELLGPPAEEDHGGMAQRFAACAACLLPAVCVVAGVRHGPVRELRQLRAIARAAQDVLLRPLPPRLDGLTLAAGQLSATRGADIGGDLYEVLVTPYGVRVVIGDVRGHGLPAVGAVAAVLGCFREAAYDEPGLDGVLRRLERAHQRQVRRRTGQEYPAAEGPVCPAVEEFVTVLLLEISADTEVQAVNCGHPWPRRIGGEVTPLSCDEPLPPLGAFPLPAEVPVQSCGRLLPGEALFLHTDGATDARDHAGRFFALEAELAATAGSAPLAPAALVRRVHSALLRHTGGRVTDDIALLVLCNDRARVRAQSAESELRRTRPTPSHP